MKREYRQLVIFGGLAFLSFLAFGALLVACVRPASDGGEVAILVVVALAEAAILLLLRRRMLFSFHRSAQHLPASMSDRFDTMPPQEQFHALCRAYEEKASAFNRYSVDRFLTRLLSDNSHTHVIENLDEQVQDILHSEAFGYRWSVYCLVYVQLEDYDSYMLKNCNGRLLLSDFRKMYDVVSHAFDVTLNRHHLAHGVEWKNATVFLVNLSGTTADTPREELEQMVDRLCAACGDTIAQIRDSFNVTLEAAVSTPFRDAIETHGIFEWLLTMKEYSDFVCGPRPVIGPADFDQFVSVPHTAPAAMEKTYYSALLAEDFVRAEQALFELEQYALGGSGFSISALKNMVHLWLSAAEDIATSSTISGESVGALDWRRGIQSCATLEQLEGLIHDFFQYLISRSGFRQNECSSTAKKVIAFLDENFACPDLSIAMLSDSLSLSPSYISRIFKRETGLSVPDYIHEKRVRVAKQLLGETDLSINDVALRVGYTTAWTMNRIFKRVVNMTPGAWRQLVRNRQEESAL